MLAVYAKRNFVRDIVFLDDDYKVSHPDLPIEKKSDSTEEDKTISHSAALEPILTDYLTQHPDTYPDTFLGDVAFDSVDIYGRLLERIGFRKTLVPINPRNERFVPEKSGVQWIRIFNLPQ